MTTYCILGSAGLVATTFANSQLPTTQPGYIEIPVDGGQVGQIWNGTAFVVDTVATQAQLEAAITTAVQAQLDATAVAHGYDDVLSACSYAAQPVGSTFQAEGLAFLTWRSAVWTQAYATLASVEAGTAQLPTPAQAVASMPAFVDPT
jgi:hypothetical protein